MNFTDSLLGKTHLPQVPLTADPPAKKARAPRYSAPKPKCSEKEFLRCVKKHKITIIRDDGISRHIKFADPGNCNQWFELVTWDDKICFSGDMGTYVFQRTEDMFTFFRRHPNDKAKVPINPSYWAEKCQASDRDGIEEWSPEQFKHTVWHWMDDSSATKDDRDEVVNEVISIADDGEWRAMTAAQDFRSENDYQLYDFWENDCKVFTYRFLWCCYAICWGIQQYDKAKAKALTTA